LGYGLLIGIPMLSLAGAWQFAALFIIMERIGKAIRSPARDTILSQASSQVGTGFGFGLHEALDQVGAIGGPLLFAAFFMFAGKNLGITEYHRAYAFLWIPFLLLIFFLFISYLKVPQASVFESAPKGNISEKLPRIFWIYTLFTFITTAGFCSFILIAFHFKLRNILPDAQIPLFYAIAMGIDAVAALGIGKLYDILKNKSNNQNAGLNLLITLPVLSLLIPFFIFSKSVGFVVVGVLCWGVVMGVHETIMRSGIADITSLSKRGTGYGIFNTAYGLAALVGNSLMGFFYDRSLSLVVLAIVAVELLALGVFFVMKKEINADK
jgi:hypothetical protein